MLHPSCKPDAWNTEMHRRVRNREKRKERRAALLCSADCGDRRAKWRRMPKQHKNMLHTLRLQRVLDRRRVARDFVNAAVGVFIEINYQRQKSQAAMPLQLGLGSASPWIATAARVTDPMAKTHILQTSRERYTECKLTLQGGYFMIANAS